MSAAGNEASNSVPTHNIHVSPGPGPPRTAQGGLSCTAGEKSRPPTRRTRVETRESRRSTRAETPVRRGSR